MGLFGAFVGRHSAVAGSLIFGLTLLPVLFWNIWLFYQRLCDIRDRNLNSTGSETQIGRQVSIPFIGSLPISADFWINIFSPIAVPGLLSAVALISLSFLAGCTRVFTAFLSNTAVEDVNLLWFSWRSFIRTTSSNRTRTRGRPNYTVDSDH